MAYKRGMMQVSVNGQGTVIIPTRFKPERWYFVELSWHPETGLNVYIDNKLEGSRAVGEIKPITAGDGKFYIGHANKNDFQDKRFSTGNFDVDEMEIWYDRREDL